MELLNQIRSDLSRGDEKQPLVTLVLAGLVALVPMALLGKGLADALITAAAVLFLVRSVLNRDFSWLREPWIAVCFVLWVYLTARGLLSIDPDRSGLKGFLWIRFIVFAAALQFLLLKSAAMRRAVLISFVAMAVFGAADALFQFATGADLFGRPLYKGLRLTGPLENPAIGMLLVFVGLPASIYLMQATASEMRAGRVPFVPAVSLLIIMAAVVLSGERMALIQGTAIFAVVALIMFKPSLKTIAATGVVGLAVFAGLFAAVPKLQVRYASAIEQLSDPAKSIYGQAMLAGATVAADNPIFGVGLKNFQAHCKQSVTDPDVAPACELIHPHQVWLQIAAETGLVGVAGFLTVFGLALWPVLRVWRIWPTEPLLMGAAIAVMMRLLPVTTSGNFFSNWRESFFWLLLGTAAAMARAMQAEASPAQVLAVTPPRGAAVQ